MGKKKVGSVHTCKNGAKYKIMPNGRARFISGPTKRGGSKKGAKKGGFLGVTRGVRAAGKAVSRAKRNADNTVAKIMY